MRGVVRVLVVCLGLGGCGSDNKDDSPSAKCRNLLNAACARYVDCNIQSGTIPAAQRDASLGSCLTDAMTSVDCSRAVGVGASYDQCVSEVNAAPCDVVQSSPMLPQSCMGVILIN